MDPRRAGLETRVNGFLACDGPREPQDPKSPKKKKKVAPSSSKWKVFRENLKIGQKVGKEVGLPVEVGKSISGPTFFDLF